MQQTRTIDVNAPAENAKPDLVTIDEQRDPFRIVCALDRRLDDSDMRRVVDYMAGTYEGERQFSEERAALIPAESALRYNGLKLKGSGFREAGVQFDRHHEMNYALPRYDWEGNYSPDIAKAFERAYLGGMTYQQAVNEYRISKWLTDRGFDTYIPMGYGMIERDSKKSWFCVLNAPYAPYWRWSRPDYDRPLQKELPFFAGDVQRRLRDMGVYLLLHGITNVEGRLVRKDFHTARFATANDSFMSRLCYYLFDTNFVLATFREPYFDTGEKGWADYAWREYMRGLTGIEYDTKEIQAFKDILIKLKTNDWADIYKRIEILLRNPITTHLAMQFANEEEQRLFF